MQPLWLGLRRFSLGIALIATASGVLLLSDLKGRQLGEAAPSLGRTWKIYVVRYVDTPTAEEAADGIINGLANAGLRRGRDFTLDFKSAQGDIATVNTIMDVAKTDNADLIMVLCTPTLQAALRRFENTPVVYTVVASGVVAGAVGDGRG